MALHNVDMDVRMAVSKVYSFLCCCSRVSAHKLHSVSHSVTVLNNISSQLTTFKADLRVTIGDNDKNRCIERIEVNGFLFSC